MTRRTQWPESVSARLVAILATFSGERRQLSLTAISRRCGLPMTTTHRLVGELATEGLLERDADGRYQVGLRLWQLASLAPRSVGLREQALPFLEDLYEATHQHAQLAVLEGAEPVCLERISGHEAVPVVSRVGGHLPAHASGVGLVLLAYASHQLQESVLAGGLPRFTEHTVCDSAQLRRRLSEIRRDGFVVSDRAIDLTTVSVAAPVRGEDDNVIAALSVVVPYGNVAPQTLVPLVRASARGMSRRLGAPSVRLAAAAVRTVTA